jgi:hypothetical protein
MLKLPWTSGIVIRLDAVMENDIHCDVYDYRSKFKDEDPEIVQPESEIGVLWIHPAPAYGTDEYV